MGLFKERPTPVERLAVDNERQEQIIQAMRDGTKAALASYADQVDRLVTRCKELRAEVIELRCINAELRREVAMLRRESR